LRLYFNTLVSSLLLVQLAFNPFLVAQPPTLSKPRRVHATTGVDGRPAQLPVTRVSLYKNGVGFFEHSGQVTGSGSVTIDFTTAQLNDVLQSLTAIDLNGGRIAGAGYNSTTPLDQQLKALPLALGEDPTSIDFYNAIRGARVEVRSSGGVLSGRILSFELRTTPGITENAPATEKHFLTVVSESGVTRTFELTPSTEVRLLDTRLQTDLNRYLELIASNRNQGLRHLTLQDNGTGTRDIRVSYISEVPVWKSTYRILFTDADPAKTATNGAVQTATLQGWAVVDNTVGADWNNIQLSLIAGAPQSFIQPLSVPYYTRRPQIPLPQEAQLSPQTHESGDASYVAPQQAVVAGVAGMSSNGYGAGVGAGGHAGSMTLKTSNRAVHGVIGGMDSVTETVSVSSAAPMMEYEARALESLIPQTTTDAFDDYFEYKLSQPITIRKNESALVPILQTKIDAERVTLWSPQQPTALRALWITNTSNLTLDRGSFSIVENGNFGGEGLLDPIHPNERRLLSYAADQAVRVSSGNGRNTRRVQRLTINKGVLQETTAEVSEVDYTVHNAAPEARTVIVEHPVRNDWTLDSEPKPAETTPSVYRYRVVAKPGETAHLHVGERHTLNQYFRLVNTSDEQLVLIFNNAHASPALIKQLEPIFAAKRVLAELIQQIKIKLSAIDDVVKDQGRLRANLSSLKGTAEERALATRYTNELNAQEDRLAALRHELEGLQQQQAVAQQDLSDKIEFLSMDEAI
jgi:hypothetical protein